MYCADIPIRMAFLRVETISFANTTGVANRRMNLLAILPMKEKEIQND